MASVGDAQTGETLGQVELHCDAEGVAFAPNSRRLALVHSGKREIQILEMPSLKLQTSFPLPKSAFAILGGQECFGCQIGFSADGKALLLGTTSGQIHRWDLATHRELPPLDRQHFSNFWWGQMSIGESPGCHYLPDGKTVVSVGKDGVIRRWYAATGKEIGGRDCYAGQYLCSALSPDGRLAAVGDACRQGGPLECQLTRKLLRKRASHRADLSTNWPLLRTASIWRWATALVKFAFTMCLQCREGRDAGV